MRLTMIGYDNVEIFESLFMQYIQTEIKEFYTFTVHFISRYNYTDRLHAIAMIETHIT